MRSANSGRKIHPISGGLQELAGFTFQSEIALFAMAEEIIWKGTSSQWKNFGAYALLVLSIPVAVGLHLWLPEKDIAPWIYIIVVIAALRAFWKRLQLKTTTYELTSERLLTTSGIFSKVTDTLELYRVRDLKIVQPFLLRPLGLQIIELCTSDTLTADVLIDYVPTRLNLGEQLRKRVEACRMAKRVRTMDLTDGSHDGHSGEFVG